MEALDLVNRTLEVPFRPEVQRRAIVTVPIITISHHTDGGAVHTNIQGAGLNWPLQAVELMLPSDRRSQLHDWMNAGVTVTASGRIEARPGSTSRLLDIDGPHTLDDVIVGVSPTS